MSVWWHDARYGLRLLRNHPGFAAAAVLTLALGIGGNTALFSVVNAVVLRPLPYPEAGRLVRIFETDDGMSTATVSPANFIDWRSQSRSFSHIAAYQLETSTFSSERGPEQLSYARASWSLMPLLQVEPALGRSFLPDEDLPGRDDVILLGHDLWQGRLGGDPEIVGRTLRLSGSSVTVVGVMPAGFQFPSQDVQYWAPLGLDPETRNRGGHYLQVIARLRDGVGVPQAEGEMQLIAARLAERFPGTNRGWGAMVRGLHEVTVGDVRPVLLLLWAAVGLVILIACTNVANLLLARATARQREIAIRRALGAGRLRLVAQMTVESVVLTGVGALAGWYGASWGVGPLVALGGAALPRAQEVAFDLPVLVFTVGLALMTGLVFGCLSAWVASRGDVNATLKQAGTCVAPGRHRLRSILVTAEVALALVLLIGAGLMIRSLVRLRGVDPGFEPRNVLTFRVSLPAAAYAEAGAVRRFYGELLERLESLPGVVAAGATHRLPLSGSWWYYFSIAGRPEPAGGERPLSQYRTVSPHYFRTMQIPLLRGRAFSDRDSESGPRVALVNEAFGRRFFPDTEPIGALLNVPNHDEPFEIVGVVGSVRHFGLDAVEEPLLYTPARQDPFWSMTIAVRTARDAPGVLGAILGQVRAQDPDLPVYDIRSMEQVVAGSLAQRRFAMSLLAAFAVVALVLSCIGVYGIMAYSVSRRTHEIGIRIALGAGARDLIRMVVGQGMLLVVSGVGIGVAGALALSRALGALLFDVHPTDPLTFSAVALLLTGVALLACYLPARRAVRVDPLVALREE